ncbi:MAG: DUF4159 domain-containing protein [Anaerolineae bacterium]|nr:DUF4159 domain-containing protein [Anaerolineae bacterium]
MDKNDLLQTIPTKRIKPVDGMAVTADVWEEAHNYHQRAQRAHAMAYHGAGIVAGLEVIASDPPDTAVYILPGVAVDPLGQTIVLPQPVAYDIGHEMEGLLYLLLSYGESRPREDEGADQRDGPMYVHMEFSIAARTALPNTPYVELARVRRRKRDDNFLDAPNPAQPGPNEIDLGFRREIGAPRDISIAVCYLGEVNKKQQGRGVAYLAHTLNRLGRYFVTVEDNARLAPGVETNTLIYLVGQGKFELSTGQINGLTNYLNKGKGTLFIESTDAASRTAFQNLFTAMNLEPEALQAGHCLLMDPHLFVTPPPGFEPENTPEVLVKEGVIVSTGNYGLTWQGEVKTGVPSREHLRSVTEWGENIVTYAWDRRRRR